MGGELVTAEKTWLEVVKAAASLEQHDVHVSELLLPCRSVVNPAWISHLNDVKNEKGLHSRSSEFRNGLLLRREVDLQTSESILSVVDEDGHALVKELKEILERPGDLTKRVFLDLVGPHLRSLNRGLDESLNEEGGSPGLLGNGLCEGTDEGAFLSSLKGSAKFLGHRLKGVLLECSVALEFWALIRVLLEKRVIVSNSYSRLIRSLVEEEQAQLLCLYASYVPDLTPSDLYSMLHFFLDSIDNPSKPFQLVRKEWRRVARIEIEKAGKNRDAIQVATNDSDSHDLEKLTRAHERFVSSAIGVAMAVDGFSSPELCIHYLLAGGQDEAVLSSAVSQLSTLQALKLTQYSVKWIERYSSYLANFPAPSNKRVPSLNQVLSWAGVLLEGHFTTLVLSADSHKDLGYMRVLVQSLVAVGTNISPLGGIIEHIRSESLLPVEKQQGANDSDYVIELLDMN